MGIFKLIKSLFNSNSTTVSTTTVEPGDNDYYFHEDFYRQIEFLPKENFDTVTRTAEEIAKQAENSFDDYGWTKCYVRSDSAFPTASKNIPVIEMVTLLINSGFSEFSRVITGYGATVVECKNTRAFENRSIVICFDFKKEHVKNIWLNSPPDKPDNNLYKQFLLSISSRYSFILSDWNQAAIIDISNPAEIDRYFSLDD